MQASESLLPTFNTTKTIFYVGNSASLVAVTVAIWIFLSFKDLRCLRNSIHTNLLLTYFLHNLFWIIYAAIQPLMGMIVSCSFYVLLTYFVFTNFMWMFVEGLYLYMLVVQTFSVEDFRLRVYTLIGWGIPIPIIITWVLVKLYVTQYQADSEGLVEDGELGGVVLDTYEEEEGNHCPLIYETPIDWIHQGPVMLLLSTNIIFLTRIMWVLITKLRSANTVETQRYRKATKALLVLIPLLGLTYMLLIALPQELEHIRAILLSTQGFWVALFYCFLNSEVQNSIRHHIERWKTARGIGEVQRGTSVRHGIRDGSPRSRSGCLRFSRWVFGNKRESFASEVTTLSTLVSNGVNTQGGITPRPSLFDPKSDADAPAQPLVDICNSKGSLFVIKSDADTTTIPLVDICQTTELHPIELTHRV